MGKLNIAHHKSYHPYRRDNIEKVKRDEEEAALKEASEGGRVMLADSEARIDLLRHKAGLDKSKRKRRGHSPEMSTEGGKALPEVLPTTGGHINLFEDLEQTRSVSSAAKKAAPKVTETDQGAALGLSAKDMKTWYSAKTDERNQELAAGKRRRDLFHKSRNDPLTSITRELASRPSSSSTSAHSSRRTRPGPSAPPRAPEEERLTRESSERERALALIAKKKREMAGSETPSEMGAGYADQFNRKEVEEAHRGKASRVDPRDRGWDSRNRGQPGERHRHRW